MEFFRLHILTGSVCVCYHAWMYTIHFFTDWQGLHVQGKYKVTWMHIITTFMGSYLNAWQFLVQFQYHFPAPKLSSGRRVLLPANVASALCCVAVYKSGTASAIILMSIFVVVAFTSDNLSEMKQKISLLRWGSPWQGKQWQKKKAQSIWIL